MKNLLFVILILIYSSSNAQKINLQNRHLNLSAGQSFNGSGDINGLIYSAEYSKFFRNRISYALTLSGTIHDEEDTLFITPPSGNLVNSSIRGTTAGVQFAAHLGFSILKNANHNLQFKLGVLGRYQSSSSPGYTILYPALTGLTFPVLYLEHYAPQRTFAFGGSTQLRYDYTIRKKITIGVLSGFQTDTNGDNITQLSLSIGRRF